MATASEKGESRVLLSRDGLQELVQRKVAEVACEPEFGWGNNFQSFMTDAAGDPVVRVAVINCAPDMDIWEGLRTPAHVGMYPLTLEDIWMHYAAANVRNTRHDGSPNPLAMPETYDEAQQHIRRAVIVSAMLAVNPALYAAYAEKIEQGDADPLDSYARAVEEVSAIVNRALGKAALALMSPERAVVLMTRKRADVVAGRTRSNYTTGKYHGPNNDHWPQNSIAVMTGLLQFGANRIPFRDEVDASGERRRFFGRYGSLVIFDGEAPITDGAGGVTSLDSERLAWLRRVNDYTDIVPEVAAARYCTYNLTNGGGETACGLCLAACPSGALRNSTPLVDGTFEARISGQKHRFWDGAVDFDAGNCCRERGQRSQLFDDYVCARCEVVCAAHGVRRSAEGINRINGVV